VNPVRPAQKQNAAAAMVVASSGKEVVDEGNVAAFCYVFNSGAAVIHITNGDGHATPINHPALV